MNIKSQPNRTEYLQILQKMSPEERLLKALELSELVKTLFLEGLKQRFPEKSEKEIHEIYVKRTIQCYNRNY